MNIYFKIACALGSFTRSPLNINEVQDEDLRCRYVYWESIKYGDLIH